MRPERDEHFGTHRPRKRFGQHFLRDQAIIDAIIAVIAPRAGEHLLEIGPGEGVLTGPLLAAGVRLDAVELDRDLVRRLAARFGTNPAFHLHAGDILDFDLDEVAEPGGSLRVVGNLPYNISSPLLLRLLFTYARHISEMVFMLQQEVVERLAAGPGGKEYGRLSVITQAICEVEPALLVPPEAFEPPPQVMSAVVRLRPRAEALSTPVRATLEKLVKIAFAQRRKILRHSLGRAVDPALLAQCNVSLQQRAEEIPVATYTRLAELCTPSSDRQKPENTG